MMSQFGITSTVAENGQEAVDILESGKDFDLIFMDLQMPVMDGYEATAIIRGNHRYDSIPIISLTADAMKEITDRCLEIGMNDSLAKPIEFVSLSKMLLKWLPREKRALETEVEIPESKFDEGLARFGGNKKLYEKALRELASTLPETWPSLDSVSANPDEMRLFVHKIKGASGNLAVDDIYTYAVEFESSLRNKAPDYFAYTGLIRASVDFKSKFGSSPEDSSEVSEVGQDEEFKKNMIALKEALEDYDLKKSTDAVDALRSKSWPNADAEALNRLYELIQEYDYIAALDELEAMNISLT